MRSWIEISRSAIRANFQAVRASVGLASNLDDVRTFLTWLEETYAQHPVP